MLTGSINRRFNLLIRNRNKFIFRLDKYYTQPAQPEKSKLRKFYDEYGKLGIGVYLTISVISISSFYTAIKMGVNMDSLLEKFNMQDNKIITKAGPFALAYGIHKIFAPVRLVLAFVITPFIKKSIIPKFK